MASKITPTLANMSPAKQLAHYRAAAKALAPSRNESTFAISVARALASVPAFYEDVRDVYRVERASRL